MTELQNVIVSLAPGALLYLLIQPHISSTMNYALNANHPTGIIPLPYKSFHFFFLNFQIICKTICKFPFLENSFASWNAYFFKIHFAQYVSGKYCCNVLMPNTALLNEISGSPQQLLFPQW